MDFEGSSLEQVANGTVLEYFQTMIEINDNHYPESLKKLMIINASKIFHCGFAIVKPFLAEQTANKIHIYGKDKWKDALLDDISADILPVSMGGTRTDGVVMQVDNKVDRKFIVSPRSRLDQLDEVQTLTVRAGSRYELEITAEEQGATLRWIFGTDYYDINFGVYRVTSTGLEQIILLDRVNSHLVAEDGEIICTHAGTYILLFDNSKSMFRSKTVTYKVEVISPSAAIREACDGSSGN